MSVCRFCYFYLAVNNKWYMELADEEHGGRSDATTYGPFHTVDAAEVYLDENFSNPGGWVTDSSGDRTVPEISPNGIKVIIPY